MPQRLLIFCLLLTGGLTAQSDRDFSSDLPVMIINVDNGADIPDEPKVRARLRVEYPNGSVGYDGFMGIERRGSTSQFLFPKKGFGLETRTADGEDLDVGLLGLPEEEDWVLHGPYSDKTLVRNALAYTLAGEIMEYAPRVRHVELMLNGDYRGVYLFTEKIKRDKHRVRIANLKPDDLEGEQLTGGYLLKIDKTTGEEPGTNFSFASSQFGDSPINRVVRIIYDDPDPEDIQLAQKRYIQQHIGEWEDALKAGAGYRRYMDMETFVDFFIINELSHNVDGYRISTWFYKEKDKGDTLGLIKMGPVWDFNLAFGNANYCAGSDIEGWSVDFGDVCPEDGLQVPFWWNVLIEDEEFQRILGERWARLRERGFSTERLHERIDSMVANLDGALDREFTRWDRLGDYVWPNEFVGDDYQAEIDYLKGWVADRAAWMDGAIMKLTPVRNAPVAEALRLYPNPTSGWVRLPEVMDRVSVFDGFGRRVLERTNTNELRLGKLPAGVYVVRAVDEGKTRHLMGQVVVR